MLESDLAFSCFATVFCDACTGLPLINCSSDCVTARLLGICFVLNKQTDSSRPAVLLLQLFLGGNIATFHVL